MSKVREHYLERYVASLKEYRAAHQPSAAEILLELNREGLRPYKLYRVDMGSNAGGEFKAQEVNPATHLSFDRIHEQLGTLDISLSPIAWNGVELVATVKALDPKPIDEWTLKWLDVEDHNSQDANGLQGVIHSVTEPRFENGTLYLSVDFSSAPVESFQELISTLKSMGATTVEISSSCL